MSGMSTNMNIIANDNNKKSKMKRDKKCHVVKIKRDEGVVDEYLRATGRNKVIGACDEAYKNFHNYLGCCHCQVKTNLKCTIRGCPCNGEAFLFPVENDVTCFGHQIQGKTRSTKVYIHRPKRSINAVKKSIERDPSNYVKKSPKKRMNCFDDDVIIDDFIGAIDDSRKKQKVIVVGSAMIDSIAVCAFQDTVNDFDFNFFDDQSLIPICDKVTQPTQEAALMQLENLKIHEMRFIPEVSLFKKEDSFAFEIDNDGSLSDHFENELMMDGDVLIKAFES